MASRTSRNIYISKCFMAVRNCINIFVLFGLLGTSIPGLSFGRRGLVYI